MHHTHTHTHTHAHTRTLTHTHHTHARVHPGSHPILVLVYWRPSPSRSEDKAALGRIAIKYLRLSASDLMFFFANLHLGDTVPDLIVVEDFGAYFPPPDADTIAATATRAGLVDFLTPYATILAHIDDAAAWASTQLAAPCSVLITDALRESEGTTPGGEPPLYLSTIRAFFPVVFDLVPVAEADGGRAGDDGSGFNQAPALPCFSLTRRGVEAGSESTAGASAASRICVVFQVTPDYVVVRSIEV